MCSTCEKYWQIFKHITCHDHVACHCLSLCSVMFHMFHLHFTVYKSFSKRPNSRYIVCKSSQSCSSTRQPPGSMPFPSVASQNETHKKIKLTSRQPRNLLCEPNVSSEIIQFFLILTIIRSHVFSQDSTKYTILSFLQSFELFEKAAGTSVSLEVLEDDRKFC